VSTDFWASVEGELAKPLVKANVKERKQAGRKLSYVEGWHVIAEANRIFGFGEWTRETLDMRCVSEHERQIGQPPNQRKGWGVSYVAKVRVTVAGVVREGYGTGHGIDADLGLAHESALKEAETDAMKRALMTFGNPFGLALYDKDQSQVCDAPPVQTAPPPAPYSKDESATVRDTIILALEKCDSHAEIFAWREQNLATFARLTREDKLVVSKAKEIREGEIDNSPQQEAAE
jgi:DNA recombination protein Rad52